MWSGFDNDPDWIATGGDINGDDIDDVIFNDWGQGTYIYFGRATWPATLAVGTDHDVKILTGMYDHRECMITGDYDRDGIEDIMLNIGSNGMSLYYGRTSWNAEYSPLSDYDAIFRTPSYWYHNTYDSGDFNGDNASDFLCVYGGFPNYKRGKAWLMYTKPSQ